jgi:LysR family hydrogen peroxide-inducible transcriptional activator
MDLRQLRSFLAVIDNGSFSGAAAALFTVQSNVSSHVARLETEVGTTLFDRRSRRVTPAGAIVESRGREILRHLGAISDDLAEIENRILGDVTFGTTPSIGLRVVPSLLTSVTSDLPEVSVQVAEAHSGTLVQQLLAEDLDLAVTTGASNAALRSRPLFTEDIVAVISSEHPLAAQRELRLSELVDYRLLLPLPDNPLYDHIAKGFAERNLPLGSAFKVGSSALVQAMASARLGLALVPATAASDSDTSGAAIRPISDLAPRRVALAMRAGEPPSRAVEAVADIVERTAQEAAQSMPGCDVIEAIPSVRDE